LIFGVTCDDYVLTHILDVSGTLDEIGVGAKKEGEKMSKKTTKAKISSAGRTERHAAPRQRMPEWGMFGVRCARECRTGTCLGCAAGRDAPGLQECRRLCGLMAGVTRQGNADFSG